MVRLGLFGVKFYIHCLSLYAIQLHFNCRHISKTKEMRRGLSIAMTFDF